MDGEKTTLTKASPKSNSLRTTVPISIVKQFGLSERDEIIWKLDIENNDFIIKVKPNKRRK